jgi:hypothetical protein
MRKALRLATTAVAVPVFVALGTGIAQAHQCTNANKPVDAGWRVLVGPGDTLSFNDPGLEQQFAKDPDAAFDRFSGILGIDFDGDGDADLTTYIVGPNGELPEAAQLSGSECNGIVNIGAYFDCISQ